MALEQGVFNVTDPAWGVLPSNPAGTNTTNLNILVSELLSSGGPTFGNGGTIQFPSVGTYTFDGPINIDAGPATLIFEGTGSQTLTTPLLQMVDESLNLFVVNNHPSTEDDNIGGIVFQDLQIAYAAGLTGGAAILVTNNAEGAGSQNIRIIRVTFQDCPQGVVFENTLEGLVDQCEFRYKNFSAELPGSAITIDIATTAGSSQTSNQILVRKCNIRTLITPNVWTGVAVYGCEHATIQNTRISGLNNGILLSPTATKSNDTMDITINDCEVDSPSAALSLTPASSTGSKLREVRVIGSVFFQSSMDTSYTGPGISISLPSGGDNTFIDTVKLIGVTSYDWSGSGLLITGGQNLQVIGGTYSGNGSHSPGIQMSGTPAYVSLVGVDMSATYPGEAAQQNALLVAGNTTSVLVKSCTMFGYSAPPVSVTTLPQSTLAIKDVAGYNDQNTPLNGGAAPTSALSASNCATPYFGPSVVTFSNTPPVTVTVTINGEPYSMSSGSIYLALPTDTIKFSAAPSTFTWIGK